MIEQTHADDTELVHRIAQDAICACYPLYYPQPVVRWFSEWHSPEKIAADIAANKVFLLRHHGTAVATATLKGAEVKRLFVLPEHQRAGYGSTLMDHLEQLALSRFGEVLVDASLPAAAFYERRGYQTIGHEAISIGGTAGEPAAVLVYERMAKA